MEKKRRIGLMGGTFDPIHNGHLQIAEYGLQQFSLDEVWFVPTGNSYHKGKQAVSTEHRCEMVKCAIQDKPYFKFCDIEVHRSGATYTADTLRELCKRYPEDQFYYMVGADSLDYMERWYEPQVIFDHAVILVAGRHTQSPEVLEQKIAWLKERFGADIRRIYKEVLSISSSEIRTGLQSGETPGDGIPDPVKQYIAEKGLYRERTV